MYYEEEIVNGVLCWRNTPDGEWIQYTVEALTVALQAARANSYQLEIKLNTAEGIIKNMKRVMDAV